MPPSYFVCDNPWYSLVAGKRYSHRHHGASYRFIYYNITPSVALVKNQAIDPKRAGLLPSNTENKKNQTKMKNPFTVCLIITTYNWPGALDLVLGSVAAQSMLPDEIIIADDGSHGEETPDLLKKWQKKMQVPVIHAWQEDNGYRKTLILNKAIMQSSSEYLIQIDGDMILHRHFVKDHIRNSARGFYLIGLRGMLTKEKSGRVLATKNTFFFPLAPYFGLRSNTVHLPMFSRFLYGEQYDSRTVLGCNFSLWRNDFISVNGYHNDMVGWGHEDIDIAMRLVNMGIRSRRLKFSAVAYHIFHELASRANEAENFKKYTADVEHRIVWCENGCDQAEKYI